MSTDVCEPDVYKNGKVVCIMTTDSERYPCASTLLDRWVQRVEERVGVPVDWHFFAGRSLLKTLGDVSQVAAAAALLPLPLGVHVLGWHEDIDLEPGTNHSRKVQLCLHF